MLKSEMKAVCSHNNILIKLKAMKKDYAVKYRAVSVDRSVWSKAFFFQQLPIRTCILNLSAPQHHAPSSTQRPFADQLRSNFAFWSWAHGTGWDQGASRAQRTMPAAQV